MEFWSTATFDQKVRRLRKYFNKYVIKKHNNACWDWNGTLLEGRGRLSFEKKQIQAHRVSWMIYHGQIPQGMYVCHTCDNKICTNPNHLFLGTCSDNIRDKFKKERSSQAKLTIQQVKEIKRALKNGQTGASLARQYGVHITTISDIKLARTWGYITY